MPSAQGIQRAVSDDRYEALLRVTKAIAACDECSALTDTFSRMLREVISFDYLEFVGFDCHTGNPVCRLLEANGKRLEYSLHAISIEKTPIAWVYAKRL
jgi:hypothetical protein